MEAVHQDLIMRNIGEVKSQCLGKFDSIIVYSYLTHLVINNMRFSNYLASVVH
jgi:hypothetical protein